MASNNLLGIWMDHSIAHLMDYSRDPVVSTTIEAGFNHVDSDRSNEKSEHLIHNKEQHQLAEYYAALGDIIKNYSSVFLFGPTNAKNELFNILKKDQHFSKINFEVANSDKMTDNQRLAFAKKFFFG
jgi:hypothetical protein